MSRVYLRVVDEPGIPWAVGREAGIPWAVGREALILTVIPGYS